MLRRRQRKPKQQISGKQWLAVFGVVTIVTVIVLASAQGEDALTPGPSPTGEGGIAETEATAAVDDPPTLSPPATITETASGTVTLSARDIGLDLPMRVNEEAALLACADVFACERIAVVPAGEIVTLIDFVLGSDVDGTLWGRVRWGEYEGYVPDSRLEEVALTPDPSPTGEGNAQAVPATQPAPGASNPRPGNCTTAVAMGLTDVEAAQWDHLDRDQDGVACYGD